MNVKNKNKGISEEYKVENKVHESKFNLSKLISTWIELQIAVNCYMDSAKDPNPLVFFLIIYSN